MTDIRDRRVAIWLLICCGLVFAMVVLGGVTRLTGSGLSMVDWRPVTGVLPPLNESDWQRAFDLYRDSPQYREVNAHMDVHDFRSIYWLEYLHRLLGRIIGIAFIVPFIVFAIRGDIARADWPKYLAMFVLGGLQGLLGWYMVKSGLVDVPSVSQYRLTAHLVAAFAIYAFMLWVALSLLYPGSRGRRHPWFGKAVMLTGLVCLTIVSGGFVAGLKAGKVFNSFPMMGDDWIVPGVMALEPWWRNFFANPALVQFDHRVLAMTTLAAVTGFWMLARRAALGPRAGIALNAMLALVIVQVTLGILTLLYHVPVALGAAHQASALLLFTAAVALVHSLHAEPAAAKPYPTSVSQP